MQPRGPRQSAPPAIAGGPRGGAGAGAGAVVAGRGGGGPPVYGDVDDSDFVHDEIRELGRHVKAQLEAMAPTTESALLAHMRAFGGPSAESKAQLRKELDGALRAVESGVYVVYRNVERPSPQQQRRAVPDECCRIGPTHRCFCNHAWADHQSSRQQASPPPCALCGCKAFAYVPNMPEEIGEGFLSRRRDFDAAAWALKCRCGHGSTSHDPVTRACLACPRRGGCAHFEGHFACGVCDGRWEAHATCVESERDRRATQRPVGSDFLPLAGVDPEFRELVFGHATARALPPPTTTTTTASAMMAIRDRPAPVDDRSRPAAVASRSRMMPPDARTAPGSDDGAVRGRNGGDDDDIGNARIAHQRSVAPAPAPAPAPTPANSGRQSACGACNAINRRLAKFCRVCGAKIEGQ